MTLVRADAIRIPLADESVDLVVTSPPYFALRSYQDDGEHYDGQIGSEPTPTDFLRALWAVSDECARVLKPGGSMFVNLGDKYAGSGGHNNAAISTPGNKHAKAGRAVVAARRQAPDRYNQASDMRAKSLMGLPWRYALGCTAPALYRAPFETVPGCWHGEPDGRCFACRPTSFPQWIGRAEIVWSKPNGLPESVTDRVRRSHEQWFHLTKSPRYFAAVDEIREAHLEPHRITAATEGGGHRRGAVVNNGFGLEGDRDRLYNPLGKLPGSVWTVPSEPLKVPAHIGVDHFAAFPQEWPRRLILGWSPSGICTACGEGRAPVVEKSLTPLHEQRNNRKLIDASEPVGNSRGINADHRIVGATEATITGYACACADPSAPTRPAVVLDPFGGTGTVAMVARFLGRYPVHVDLSADYLRLARWRIFTSRHAAKAEARTNRERQGSLLL